MIQLMALSLTAEYKQHPLTVFPRPQKKPDNHKIAPKASRFFWVFPKSLSFPKVVLSQIWLFSFFYGLHLTVNVVLYVQPFRVPSTWEPLVLIKYRFIRNVSKILSNFKKKRGRDCDFFQQSLSNHKCYQCAIDFLRF